MPILSETLFHRSQRNDYLIVSASFPLYLLGVGRYGWRLGVLLLISCTLGILLEEGARRIQKDSKRGYGVTAWFLLPLVFPPALPLLQASMAIFFALMFTVVFFGGHGRAIVSPVAFGWTFASLSFAQAFGYGYVYPFSGVFTGFSHWAAGVPTVDNPYILFSAGTPGLSSALFRGGFPQPSGAAYPLVIILLGTLLLLLRAVDFRIFLSFVFSYLAVFFLVDLTMPGLSGGALDLLMGNTLLTAFFILPNQRTISRTFQGRWITGIIAGIAGALIRVFSAFPDGILYAVLLAGIFAGIVDHAVLQKRFRKEKA